MTSDRRGVGFLAIAAALLALGVPARAEGPFAALNGTWSGGGQVRLAGGQSETIRCRAYYSPKSVSSVNLAVRCASTSHKIDMRASLSASGNSVSGTWEERSFNAAGDVSGRATPARMNLAISGSGLTGSLTITTSGGSQSIRISTQGAGFSGLTMRLSKG
jgi:hypothetical protein